MKIRGTINEMNAGVIKRRERKRKKEEGYH